MKTFKNIVVATDFSDNSKSAYHYAQQMATRFSAALKVVYFFELPVSPTYSSYLDLMPNLSDLEAAADERLSRFVSESDTESGDTVVVSRVKTTYKAQPGFGSDGLIELSQDASVDLMILGASGEHGWADKLFGSVAVRVSREAYCPVLLIPHGATFKGIHHMVYTSNFDSAQSKQIRLALDFAKYFMSAIHFVHVITDSEDSGMTEEILFKYLIDGEQTKVPFTIENVHAAIPSEGIHNYLSENPTDLLVTVTHHRSFWEKFMHVSTSKALAWNIETPLLVLHHNEISQPPT